MRIALCSVVVSVAGLLAACDHIQPVSPTATSSPPLPPFYAVSGQVTEMTPAGPMPVAGVLVQETYTRHSGITDAEGRYQIAEVRFVSSIRIVASRTGYVTETITRAITGDATVDIELDPRNTYTLTGVISEVTPTGPVGIPGVGVSFSSYVSKDDYAEGETTTDDEGRYRLPGVWGADTYTAIWLEKTGYRIDLQQAPLCDFCYRSVALTSDTVMDIQLERLSNVAIDLARDYNPFFHPTDSHNGAAKPASAFAKGSTR